MLDSDLPVLSELTHRIEQIAGINAQQNRGAELYQVRRERAEARSWRGERGGQEKERDIKKLLDGKEEGLRNSGIEGESRGRDK